MKNLLVCVSTLKKIQDKMSHSKTKQYILTVQASTMKMEMELYLLKGMERSRWWQSSYIASVSLERIGLSIFRDAECWYSTSLPENWRHKTTNQWMIEALFFEFSNQTIFVFFFKWMVFEPWAKPTLPYILHAAEIRTRPPDNWINGIALFIFLNTRVLSSGLELGQSGFCERKKSILKNVFFKFINSTTSVKGSGSSANDPVLKF